MFGAKDSVLASRSIANYNPTVIDLRLYFCLFRVWGLGFRALIWLQVQQLKMDCTFPSLR